MKKIIAIFIIIGLLSSVGNVINSKANVFYGDYNKDFGDVTAVIFDDDIHEMINLVDESTLEYYLEKLVNDYPCRGVGSDNCIMAGEFIYDELVNIPNLRVWKEDWSMFGDKHHPGHYSGTNVLAELKTPISDDTTFVFLVHHDCQDDSPGADDDGSGVTALLVIADIMSRYDFEHTILFCSSSGEEKGFLGDYHTARNLYEDDRNIANAITADAIGYMPDDCDEGSQNVVRLYGPERSKWIADVIIDVNIDYNAEIGLTNVITAEHYPGNSGHKAYDDYGYDCFKFFEGKANPGWEQPPYNQDTLDKINFSYLTKVTKLIIGTLATFANMPKREPKIKIVFPKEDTNYKNGDVKLPSLTKGKTWISRDVTVEVEVSDTDGIEKVMFELLKGDNEYGNEKREGDKNDEWPRPVIATYNDTDAPYEWTIEDKYSNWYTIRATAFDTNGDYNCDEIEVKYVWSPGSPKEKSIYWLLLQQFPFLERLLQLPIFEKLLQLL